MKALPVALAAALAFSALAHAHGPPSNPTGQPKLGCEAAADMAVHEYAGPLQSQFAAGPLDGSTPPCPGAYGPDWDGHREFWYGGGWLLVDDGNGATIGGATVCWGVPPDHAPGTAITVQDVSGLPTAFTVAIDAVNLFPGPLPNCGDFETDEFVSCTASCTPSFAGVPLDGSYSVIVAGGATGHIVS